jgi:hypothetical protein
MSRHRTIRHAVEWRRRRRRCLEVGVSGSDKPKVQRRKVRKHRLCWRQAALHGASGATHPQMGCPQRHRATNHRLLQWRVTELYDAQWRRRRRRKMPRRSCILGVKTTHKVQRERVDTAYVNAGWSCKAFLMRRVRASYVSVTWLREHSPPSIMARHRSLRRAMASASVKMPRTCISVSVRVAVIV